MLIVMTEKQKAEAYDEALEKAQSALKDGTITATAIAYLQDIFPELKESENEKIRKALLEMVHYTPDVECEKIYKINKEECIAWLEKQGEQNNSNVKDYNSIDPHFGKPTDKIEPNFNFNVGQWIIATGKCVYLITKIDGFNVTLVDVDGNEYVFDTSSLEDAHLWTIQDAKDGDVLCSHHSEVDYPWIGIFHKLNTDNTFDSHCYLPAGEHGKFCPPSKKDIFGRKYVKNHLSTYMVPATKEQRDILFQKMKEAGYEWDAEKKILNEIKNEIEIPFSAKDSELQEATYYIPKGFHAEINDDKVVIKKGEKLANVEYCTIPEYDTILEAEQQKFNDECYEALSSIGDMDF